MIYTLIQHSVAEQGPSAPPDSSGASPQPQPQPQQQRVSIHKPFTQSRVPSDLPMHPAPRHITEEELHVLEGCLHRWRSEVENDTRGAAITSSTHTHTHLHIYMPCPFSHACHVLVMPDLQGSISRIHRTIELMYSDKTMMQVRFKRKINKVLDYNN